MVLDPWFMIVTIFVLGRKMRMAVVLRNCATPSLVTDLIGGPPWAPMMMVMRISTLPQSEWSHLEMGQKQNMPLSRWLVLPGLLPVPSSMIMNLFFPTRNLMLHHLTLTKMIQNSDLQGSVSASLEHDDSVIWVKHYKWT